MNSTSARYHLFYAWFVVAGAFAITFVGFGSAYTFSFRPGPKLPPLRSPHNETKGCHPSFCCVARDYLDDTFSPLQVSITLITHVCPQLLR